MVLPENQKQELNKAIADYFKRSGYLTAFEGMQKDAGNPSECETEHSGHLEENWTSVITLQKRLLDLEQKLAEEEAKMLPKPEKIKWNLRQPEMWCLRGHQAAITKVLFHPVHWIFFSSSEDATIKIWEADSGYLKQTLKKHEYSVLDIALNQCGTLLASGSEDAKIKIWSFDGNLCELMKTLSGHESSVLGVSFIPNNDYVVSSSRDKTIKLWDVTSGHCIHTFRGHSDMVMQVKPSPDGSLMATGSRDKAVRIWNISSKQCTDELYGHENAIECIVWAPDNAYDVLKEAVGWKPGNLVFPPLFLVSGSRDRTIKIWDVTSGACKITLENHHNWVRQIVFHPQGKHMMSASDDKTICVWDIGAKQCVQKLTTHISFCSTVDIHAFFPLVVTGSTDYTVKIWKCC